MVLDVSADLFLRWLWVLGLVFCVVGAALIGWLVEALRLGVLLLFSVVLVFVVLARALPGTFSAIGLTVLFTFVVFLVGKALFDSRRFGDLYYVARQVIPDYIIAKHILPRLNFVGMRMQYFKGYFLVEYPRDGLVVAWHKDLGVVAHDTMSLEQFKKVFVPEEAAPPRAVIGEVQDVERGGEVESEDR